MHETVCALLEAKMTEISTENASREKEAAVHAKLTAFLLQSMLSQFSAAMREQGYIDLEVIAKLSDGDLNELGKAVGMKGGHVQQLKAALLTHRATLSDTLPTLLALGSTSGPSKLGQSNNSSAVTVQPHRLDANNGNLYIQYTNVYTTVPFSKSFLYRLSKLTKTCYVLHCIYEYFLNKSCDVLCKYLVANNCKQIKLFAPNSRSSCQIRRISYSTRSLGLLCDYEE
jgi:hypothetical protein